MQRKRNRATGRAAKAAPKPLSAAAVKRMEAAGQKVWRLRTGEVYATRADRRAARAARKEKS
jgi:hypothetical protein